MEAIVPEHLGPHFKAARSARLLTVQGMIPASGAWLANRLLADWVSSLEPPDGARSAAGLAIFSVQHNFQYYVDQLQPFVRCGVPFFQPMSRADVQGIDLAAHEARGTVRFIGNLFADLLASPGTTPTPPPDPAVTLDAALELLSDEAERLKNEFGTALLFLDSPEQTMAVFEEEEEDVRVEHWFQVFQQACYEFHHAIASVFLTYPNMQSRTPGSFETAMASMSAALLINEHSDMAVAVRGMNSRASGFDGSVSFMYRMDSETTAVGGEADDETFSYRLRPNGRGIEVTKSASMPLDDF